MELEYYSKPRHEILPYLQLKPGMRVLDIGCGAGSTSELLKKIEPSVHISGIELVPSIAERAKSTLDDVQVIDLNQCKELPFQVESFDMILCLDVLEHLIDPWARAREIALLLKKGGTLLISLPNTRHAKVVLPLLLKGEWAYEEGGGLLDITHLRFFTKKTSLELAKQTGLELTTITHTGMEAGSKTWLANILSLGLLKDFLVAGYLIQLTRKAEN